MLWERRSESDLYIDFELEGNRVDTAALEGNLLEELGSHIKLLLLNVDLNDVSTGTASTSDGSKKKKKRKASYL